MPRYNYQCADCGHSCVVFHLMDEDAPNCSECDSESPLSKELGIPFFKVGNISTSQKAGELTKEYIELNKELLKEEKTKRGTYDET